MSGPRNRGTRTRLHALARLTERLPETSKASGSSVASLHVLRALFSGGEARSAAVVAISVATRRAVARRGGRDLTKSGGLYAASINLRPRCRHIGPAPVAAVVRLVAIPRHSTLAPWEGKVRSAKLGRVTVHVSD